MLRQLFGSRPAECAGGGAGAAGGDTHDFSYYLKCLIGGSLACGVTHTLVCPLDIVKCKIQADPTKFKGMGSTFKYMLQTEGVGWTTLGWLPTCIGYHLQGLGKFGFYEIFKDLYGGALASAVGEEKAFKLRTVKYGFASASAELIADTMLCPFEAVKVRMQTSATGTFPTSFGPAFSQINQNEGINGFYKGLAPLWARQIPYTIMKFVVFERTVEFIYKTILGKGRDEFGRGFNLSMTFAAGYIAGVVCAVVSHPADTLFTAYNKKQTSEPFMQGIKKIYAETPAGGLWKGLIPRIFMVGTLTGLQWWIYDTWKTACGLQATGVTK